MISKSRFGGAVATWCVVGLTALPPYCPAATPSAAVSVARHDTNHDGGLDLAEAETAASAHFDELNKDSDRTLETVEVRGILGEAAFRAADLDHDGTISKPEYLALVARLFKKTDLVHYGKLFPSDLGSKSGIALRKLLG